MRGYIKASRIKGAMQQSLFPKVTKSEYQCSQDKKSHDHEAKIMKSIYSGSATIIFLEGLGEFSAALYFMQLTVCFIFFASHFLSMND